MKSQVPTNASKADSKLQDIVREAAEYLAKLEAELLNKEEREGQ